MKKIKDFWFFLKKNNNHFRLGLGFIDSLYLTDQLIEKAAIIKIDFPQFSYYNITGINTHSSFGEVLVQDHLHICKCPDFQFLAKKQLAALSKYFILL